MVVNHLYRQHGGWDLLTRVRPRHLAPRLRRISHDWVLSRAWRAQRRLPKPTENVEQKRGRYPPVIELSYWRWLSFSWFTYKRLWFSIAMLLYQRVPPANSKLWFAVAILNYQRWYKQTKENGTIRIWVCLKIIGNPPILRVGRQ